MRNQLTLPVQSNSTPVLYFRDEEGEPDMPHLPERLEYLRIEHDDWLDQLKRADLRPTGALARAFS